MLILQESDWRSRQQRHRARVRPWIEPRLDRRRRGERHPVDDFLFEYYPYSPTRLMTWHPGHGVVLAGDAEEFLGNSAYCRVDEGVTTCLDGLVERRARLDLAIRLLERTGEREANLGCFGMHEWAMVYRQRPEDLRHQSHPLRLDSGSIAQVVDDIGLRCTHIDAYRFFTPEALPLNAGAPTRATQDEWEQPGCLHATMDLYKYAMWFSPWVSSDLVADAFALARRARELDMRAAPYDLRDLGYQPIRVETAEGRREYVSEQRAIAEAAEPIRRRLLSALRDCSRVVRDPVLVAQAPTEPDDVLGPPEQRDADSGDPGEHRPHQQRRQ